MQLEVEPDGLDRAEIALVTELELLRSEPPADEEIERAISQLEREFWSSLQTTQAARASWPVSNWPATGNALSNTSQPSER